jgi:hypothetical protein
LILGPLPIIGSSWAVSAWFKPEPGAAVVHNEVLSAGFWNLFSTGDRPTESTDDAEEHLTRACRQAGERLEQHIGQGCRVIVRPPFVLGGDLTSDELNGWHGNTIRPAMRAMDHGYFRTAPTQPITVLLFRGEQSYNRYAQLLFGESGISIYGYYKPNVRTLLLNLDTGTGTLLHELTHALMDFDFPEAPDWLNEGLASLHEQCRFRGGEGEPWLEGLVNWRLKGLQEFIRAGRLRSLAALVEAPDFRGPLEGTNYAQARYFCIYLQRKDLLAQLYRRFRDRPAGNGRARDTVAELFGQSSWHEIDQDFQRWVLELEAPK